MKKLKVTVASLLVLILAGCSGGADWQGTIEPITSYTDQGVPFKLHIQEGGKGITGLEIEAELEMKHMDHGSVPVSFADQGDGIYEGIGQVPMGGDWIAVVSATDGKRKKELILPFTIKE
ncbi:FixH family protein [Ammoniphilus sp. YIM 78166]|uniref:FixH family protein n=1 Tax=Ammoniphilus sp. YIM 78166 TaxID=1644106 RepID=UPI00106F4762|nr:FixH family protein [Ammoniphilus sp. YIM 78166]